MKHKTNLIHLREVETKSCAFFYPLRSLCQCKAALRLTIKAQDELRGPISFSLELPAKHGCPGAAPLPGDISKL